MQDDISVEDFRLFCKRNSLTISRALDKLITLLYKYNQSNSEKTVWTISMQKQTQKDIKPLFSNVLIRPIEAETKTSGGIIIPDSAQDKQSTIGIVMAVGEGHISPKGDREKMIVKVGDRVMYKKWGGNEVKVEGQEWTIVEQKDILAILS